MELILLIGIATALFVILVTLLYLKHSSSSQKNTGNNNARNPAEGDFPRRAHMARNQQNHIRNNANQHQNAAPARQAVEEDDESDDERVAPDFSEKMGAKKRAKLEAKAEKKVQREAEIKHREDQKKKDAVAEEERKKLEDREKEEELKREEAEKKAKEEQERKEHEEYLKMKEAFSVEEEGYDEEEDDDKANLLQNFIDFIKNNKVIVLEDLAAHFKLKTQAAIDRIVELQSDGRLSGVIDDRGKFIYISEEELTSIAKFIKQRGRVSIQELADSSNNLINLTPVVEA